MADIFEFWAPLTAKQHWHPADSDVLKRLNKSAFNFDLNCLPWPIAGPLKTARVVLLFLSPGLTDDDKQQARSPEGRQFAERQWSGSAPMPSDVEHAAGADWWRKKTNWLEVDWETRRYQVAGLEIAPYHSEHLHDRAALCSLPSARIALGWAQSVLFPEAIAGRRVVVCVRSPRYWGLMLGKSWGNLFAPETNQRGYMRRSPMRDQIIRAAHAVLP